MKNRRIMLLGIGAALAQMLSTTAFAIEESDVEAAINASSAEAVSGNVFIWFLCALAFLKISQKIDSFMSSLGVNVGRTGGSMLGELMIAGRALGAAAKATGGAIGNLFGGGPWWTGRRSEWSNSPTGRRREPCPRQRSCRHRHECCGPCRCGEPNWQGQSRYPKHRSRLNGGFQHQLWWAVCCQCCGGDCQGQLLP